MAEVLTKLEGHALYPIVSLPSAQECGAARYVLFLGARSISTRAPERRAFDGGDAAGLRLKPPKSRAGRRIVSLPAGVVEVLREHRRRQMQERLLLGQGRAEDDDLVFKLVDGSPYPPDTPSRDWGNVVRSRKLPCVMFHSSRHSHVSALIAAGLDVVAVKQAHRPRQPGHYALGLRPLVPRQG